MNTKVVAQQKSFLISSFYTFFISQTKLNWDNIVLPSLIEWLKTHSMTFKEIFDSLQPISCSAEEACILGFFYQFGLGTTRSYEASFNWYQVAVEKGEPFALIQLGECYERSRGCQEDKSKTVKYYQKSAELGHPQAFYKLVEYQKKRQHQLIWLQKSTVNGFKPAIATMAALLLCGNGVLKDKHEAIKIVFKYAPGEDKVDFRRKVLEYCFNSFP